MSSEQVPAGQRVVAAKADDRRAPIAWLLLRTMRRRAGQRAERNGVGLAAERERSPIWPFGVPAGRCFSSAATCGRLPATDCSTARPASVGAPFSVKPEPELTVGPALVRAEEERPVRGRPARRACRPTDSPRGTGASRAPAALSRLLREFRLLSLWNQNADPLKLLVPLLVTTLTTEPAARPNSAANWFVISRTSWTMSVLLIGCCRPVTLGSLLSWPSIMKLFERSRMPFDGEVRAPEAKRALAAAKLADAGRRQRQGEDVADVAPCTGSSATRVRIEADADFGGRRVEQRRVGAHFDRSRSIRRLELDVDDGVLVQRDRDPGADVPREAGQLDRQLVVADRHVEEPIEPFFSLTAVRTALVSTFRTVTVAPGTTASCLSVTVPWMVPVVDCAARRVGKARHARIASRPTHAAVSLHGRPSTPRV